MPRSGFDRQLLIILAVLLIIGAVMVYSSSWPYASSLVNGEASKESGVTVYFPPDFYGKKHIKWIGLGLLVMFIVSFIDYRKYKRFSAFIYIGAFILCLLVFTPLGKSNNTFARRWLVLYKLEFMPSDLLKVACVIMMAVQLESRNKYLNDFRKGFLPLVLFMGITVLPIILQPNLSTTIVVTLVLGCMYIVAGMDLRYMLLSVPALAVALVVLLHGDKNAYRLERIRTFLNPLNDYHDTGWQLSQALFAVSSGGLLGVGIGRGRQKFLYLSEAHNDFIFAVIAEELGFIGSVTVIIVYLLLIRRGFYIAANAADRFGRYLASGITFMLGFQALVNIGVALGAIPPTGLVLPFISYGGTSLIVSMGLIGILLNISKKKGLSTTYSKRTRVAP